MKRQLLSVARPFVRTGYKMVARNGVKKRAAEFAARFSALPVRLT